MKKKRLSSNTLQIERGNVKAYIGDSVYAEWDGYDLTLTTENGYPDDPRNRIVLEPEVWSSLVAWLDRVKSDTANARLEKENAMLRAAIVAFVNANEWAADTWKAQPHIKRLFDIANAAGQTPAAQKKETP